MCIRDSHAAARGWRIVLCGGRSELERSTTDAILAAMQAPALDLVGKDTLKQLPALLERADLVITPDSGPVSYTHLDVYKRQLQPCQMV